MFRLCTCHSDGKLMHMLAFNEQYPGHLMISILIHMRTGNGLMCSLGRRLLQLIDKIIIKVSSSENKTVCFNSWEWTRDKTQAFRRVSCIQFITLSHQKVHVDIPTEFNEDRISEVRKMKYMHYGLKKNIVFNQMIPVEKSNKFFFFPGLWAFCFYYMGDSHFFGSTLVQLTSHRTHFEIAN